jgi:hypothetical protein
MSLHDSHPHHSNAAQAYTVSSVVMRLKQCIIIVELEINLSGRHMTKWLFIKYAELNRMIVGVTKDKLKAGSGMRAIVA